MAASSSRWVLCRLKPNSGLEPWPKSGVAILGIYVADLAFRAARQPIMGETILGSSFAMGPGGKGSNQTVAAARAGAAVTFITKLGKDDFGEPRLPCMPQKVLR